MGNLSVDGLANMVEQDEIDTVVVAFTDHYGRSMGKRFDAGFFMEEGLTHGTHACDYLLTVDMNMDPVDGYTFANWSTGYGDVHMVPDINTLRLAAWTERTAMVQCDVVDQGTHELVSVAPRTILRHQVDRAADHGLRANAASELEFFIYEDDYRSAHKANHSGLTPAGWYVEDYHLLQTARVEPLVGAARRALGRSGIPVENSKGEAATGQHELNVRYAEVLTMADRHVVMKQCIKELADQGGQSVTFMAKPHADAPGNSCHIHMSLVDASGQNAFVDSAGNKTETFRWFLGGWMAHVNDVMAFYAPTINSYKRYAAGSWAPTRVAWSTDNRTAGFRVVGHGQSTRIECRIPGGDVNPYLVYAAALASGIDGIEQHIEPPPEFEGDVYNAHDVEHVPTTLRDAVAHMDNSAMAREVFGDDVVDHYAHFYGTEITGFDAAVTDWEKQRYFEQI
ncbi:MAG: glutamine synthetase [Actinomycetia bacterium]|nr:glutamine synthetase [Actinomycetes bacterium]MCP4957809.1 glutamine synthetase [Actinomycetes bacterium]